MRAPVIKILLQDFSDRCDLGPDPLSCVERIGLLSRPLDLEYGELVFEFTASSSTSSPGVSTGGRKFLPQQQRVRSIELGAAE
jgi:hypothetical protein